MGKPVSVGIAPKAKYKGTTGKPLGVFHSKEALQRILDTTVQNIMSFIRGEPINIVEPRT